MDRSNASLWLPRAAAADLIGLSARQFDEAIRPKVDEAAVRGSGKSLRFYAADVVAALVRYRLDQAKPVLPLDEDEALLMGAGGGNSPALERLRMAKAIRAERENEEDDGILVRKQLVLDALRPAATAMRGAGERLARKFGNEAAGIYNDAIDDFTAAVERFISNESSVDGNPQ